MSCKSCKKELKMVAPDVKWKEITKGGTIPYAGNAELFKTGDWRSMKPIWNQEKCKQCFLCHPVCPDSSIMLDADGMMYGIDYDHCKGCGICAKACPFKAIDFVEENK